MKVDFIIQVVDNDYSVPVKVNIINNTIGAEKYTWTFVGAEPSFSNNKDVGTIQYNKAGSFIIKLEASNQYGGKDTKELILNLDAAIQVGFSVTNSASYFPDATILIKNLSIGATTFEWTFEGGNPSSSTQEQPGNVVFSIPGSHTISLKVGNGRETFQKDTTIIVLPDIENDFDITWLPVDNDMEVPFVAYLNNKSKSATNFNWSFSGANITSSNNTNPSVVYSSPGTYSILLEASNDKKKLSRSKMITLLPNRNLFSFNCSLIIIRTMLK